MLKHYNYKPSKATDRRRQVLKKAIQESSFDTVLLALQDRKENLEGYKKDRAEADLSWLKKRSNRYYTDILQT